MKTKPPNETPINSGLQRIDAILATGAVSRRMSIPPAIPLDEGIYIVGLHPKGDWAGHAGDIAYYNMAWRFITPNAGMTLWVNDEDAAYCYTGATWEPASRAQPSLDQKGLIEKLESVYAPNAGAQSVKSACGAIVRQHFTEEKIIAAINAEPIPVPSDEEGYFAWLKNPIGATSEISVVDKPDTLIMACDEILRIGDSLRKKHFHSSDYNKAERILREEMQRYLRTTEPVPVSLEKCAKYPRKNNLNTIIPRHIF